MMKCNKTEPELEVDNLLENTLKDSKDKLNRKSSNKINKKDSRFSSEALNTIYNNHYSTYTNSIPRVDIIDNMTRTETEGSFVNYIVPTESKEKYNANRRNNEFGSFSKDNALQEDKQNSKKKIIPFPKKENISKANEAKNANKLNSNNNINSNNYTNNNVKKVALPKTNFSKAYNKSLSPVPGSRLYHQYIDKSIKKNDHIKKLQEMEIEDKMKEATFKPKINLNSRNICSRSPIHNNSSVVENRLINYGKKIKDKHTREKNAKNKEDLNLSHIPSVGDVSQILGENKRKNRVNYLMDKSLNHTLRNNKSNLDSSYISSSRINIVTGKDVISSDEELKALNNYSKSFVNNTENVNQTAKNKVNINQSNASSNYTFSEIKNHNFFKPKTSSINNITLNKQKNASNNKFKSNIKLINQTYTEGNNVNNYNNNSKIRKSISPITIKGLTKNNSRNISPSLNNSKLNKSNISNSFIEKNKHMVNSKLENKSPLHEFLYRERDIKIEKNNEYSKIYMSEYYPFQPTIPESSKLLIQRNETKDQFIDRLVNSKHKHEELIIEKRMKNEIPVDGKTGQKLYKPLVNRGPIDPKAREVTVNLDSYYDSKLLSNKNKIQKETLEEMEEQKKAWIERSTLSILKMKMGKYKEIFNLMDSDKDGLISAKFIKLSDLDSELLKTLTPILEELQKENKIMDLKEFCLKADKCVNIKLFDHSEN